MKSVMMMIMRTVSSGFSYSTSWWFNDNCETFCLQVAQSSACGKWLSVQVIVQWVTLLFAETKGVDFGLRLEINMND